jgi:hypothetical protein
MMPRKIFLKMNLRLRYGQEIFIKIFLAELKGFRQKMKKFFVIFHFSIEHLYYYKF